MDDRQIEKVLQDLDVPAPDENARKQALNLAMAAFDDAQAQKENKKRAGRQGFGFLGRLMGRSKPDAGDRPMNKRYVFGGMATAMTVVLAVAVTYQTLLVTDADLPLSTKPGSIKPNERGAGVVVGGKVDAPADPRANAPAPVATPMSRAKNEREAFAIGKSSGKSSSSGRRSIRSDDSSRTREGDRRQAEVTRGVITDRLAKSKEDKNAPAARRGRDEKLRSEVRKAQKSKPVGQIVQPRGIVQSFRGGTPGGPTTQERVSRSMQQSQAKHRAYKSADNQPSQYRDVGRDRFGAFVQNPVKRVADAPVSTFSIDVDTASYAFTRRQLNRGVLPQKNAVRVEELINYFDYAYPVPETRERPFTPSVTVTPSPWKKGNKLIHIGIKGYDIDKAEKPRSNLVFLLDVSGSMNSPDKLPRMISSLKMLLGTLGADDTVAIVVYAGAAGTVLEPTKVAEKHKILAALDRLRAGGSTAGAAGIRQAYALAQGTYDKNAVNRVILATDGDFNVGITNRNELKSFVERKRKTGVFLSVLGFGQGNLNDHLMQTLAQNGNGVAAHIDTLNEARKVLVDEASSTLFPIAKDVKLQVEFNPKTVAEYRLIGYETRALKREDFNNDKVDAGDIGAGHTVTAIYEVTPVDSANRLVDPSRYKAAAEPAKTDLGNEYAFLKIRYKLPKEDTSTLITRPITTADETDRASTEARWATAVAAFGQLLKGGRYTGSYSYDDVIALGRSARGDDPFGYRTEFLNLVRLAKSASALPRLKN